VDAGIADTVGLGPRATALGGSYAARPGDWAAAWYNPAGLSPRPGVAADAPGFLQVAFGLAYAHPVVSVSGLGGEEVPLAAPTPDTAGLMVGTRFDLGQPFGVEGLGVGVALYLPTDLFDWQIRPDDDVQWAFLTDRTQHVGVHAGAAFRPWPWLAVGVGVDVLFDVATVSRAQVVGFSQETDEETGELLLEVDTQLGEDVTMYARVAPTAGLLLVPAGWLRLALAYRGENMVEDWGHTRIVGAPGMGDLGYTHLFAHYYRPHELTLAGAVRAGGSLWLSADLTWGQWSEGLTTYHSALGPGRFGDTLTTAVGLEWTVAVGLRVLCGYRHVPRPFDNLGGPDNLLANDQHVGSAGMDVLLDELLGRADLPLTLSWAVQVPWLVEREERKDFRRFASDARLEANPGAAGYRYGGLVPAVSVALEMRW